MENAETPPTGFSGASLGPSPLAEDSFMDFVPHMTSTPYANLNVPAAHLGQQAFRPSLSDTATREESKALAARHKATPSLSQLSENGGGPSPTIPTTSTSSSGIAPTPDGSTEEDDVSPSSHVAGLTNVLYPPPETVQGAALVIHGIKRKGAKSRVETQIKMRISLVQRFDMGGTGEGEFSKNNGMMDLLTPPISLLSDSPSHDFATATATAPSYARIGTFRAIRLQPGLGVKRRAKKSQEIDAALSQLPAESVLGLETEVWCTDNPGRRAWACLKCVMRERKRAMSKSSAGPGGGRRAAGKARKMEEDDDAPQESRSLQSEQDLPVDAEGLTQEDRNRIILFNCGNLVELVQGECELPMRVTCYCRHHKEKTGFRIVMNLRDMNGRLVARGETPTIMITDDHKTSGTSRISTTGTGTDTGIISAASGRSGVSESNVGASTGGALVSRPRAKKPREPSASTEDERRATPGSNAGPGGKAGKGKPYDRPSLSTTTAGGAAGEGVVSPRTSGFTTHGLSMTPLNGRSIPGSPAAGGAGAGSYFSLPVAPAGIQPGSGTVSPSLLMSAQGHEQGTGNGIGSGVYDALRGSVPNSPPQQQGISAALPAISQRLSDWAAESGRQGWRIHQHHQMGFPQPPIAQQFHPQQQQQQPQQQQYQSAPQPTGLALNLPAMQGEPLLQSMMGEDDPTWAYASSEGGLSQHGGQGSSVLSQDTGSFTFASPRSSLHGHDGGYGYHSNTGSVAGASDISFNGLQAMRFTEPEPDFESMLNLSPQESSVDLPMGDGMSPASNASNPDSYHSLGWSPQPAVSNAVQSVLQPPIFDTTAGARSPEGPPKPKITRLVPMEGPTHGGIEVTVLGENFYPGMVCAFGPFHALTVQTYGPTTIVCVLPPSPNPGQVPVHVLDPNGQPQPQQPWEQSPICFTYQDATDRKLMEMALTAVGLRVTGKVVGAVEIARRIMSAPGAGHEGADADQQNMTYQRGDMSLQEQVLADELAKTVYSTAKDTQTAILKFLSAFIIGPSGEHGSRRRRHSQAALNHVNSEGQTLLHLASLLGYDRLVQLLLRANATIDIHDRNGYSALAFAAVAGSVPCVKLLLEAGAKVGAYTFTNQTAHSLALQASHRGIARLLTRPVAGKPVKKARRLSLRSTGESVDADNPSSTETDSMPSDGLLGAADALSPSRLTTANDIAAVQNARPAIPLRGSVEAKSDGTVTPRAGRVNGLLGTTHGSDDPPPYAAVDGASWLQRTLSHIPGTQRIPPTPQLRDFIPPVVWDKLPSAQLLIPHLPNLPSPSNFRPGDIMEQQWASQAWLAVPIQAWMNALPKVGQAEENTVGPTRTALQTEEPAASNVPLSTRETVPPPAVRRYKTPTRDYPEARATVVKSRRGASASKRKGRPENTRYMAEEMKDEQLQRDKKPDRMLFLFWLPVLAMAFCYTIIAAVPYAIGRAILAPVMRVFT